MYDVFFVLEAKFINASLEEAENQCLRSGCAMVNTRRVLNNAATLQQAPKQQATLSSSVPGPTAATAPLPSPSSADMDSFAFTMALGPQDARIFANWALVEANGGVEWHMHQLRHYNFRSLDEVNRLHHDMDNILDWGVSSRKRKVVELCRNIEKKTARGIGAASKEGQDDDRRDRLNQKERYCIHSHSDQLGSFPLAQRSEAFQISWEDVNANQILSRCRPLDSLREQRGLRRFLQKYTMHAPKTSPGYKSPR